MQSLWIVFLVLPSLLPAYVSAKPKISPKLEYLEDLLYGGSTESENQLQAVILGCPERKGSAAHSEAEWIRLAYHDMATHNSIDGTGGLDGSIYHELDREENVGMGMKRTVDHFRHFIENRHISRADIIALGVVVVLAECGGPLLSFRGGRIDATVAGPFGVPRPHQDFDTHISAFKRQGFNHADMIGLVACGHTFGGVHHPDFEEIVPPGSDPSEERVSDFDGTTKFDNKVVTDYLAGNTDNPLLSGINSTFHSDSRIFSSDGNVTMKSLSSSEAYSSTCKTLFERMIDTVPRSVTLSEVIQPVAAKVSAVHLSIGPSGLLLGAALRLPEVAHQRTVKMFWADKNPGGLCTDRQCFVESYYSESIASTYATRQNLQFVKYHFEANVDMASSVSTFWFEVEEEPGQTTLVVDNDGVGYDPGSDHLILSLEKSFARFPRNSRSQVFIYTMVVATKVDKPATRVYATYRIAPFTDPAIIPVDKEMELLRDPTFASPATPEYEYWKAEFVATKPTFDLFSVVDGEKISVENMQGAWFTLNT